MVFSFIVLGPATRFRTFFALREASIDHVRLYESTFRRGIFATGSEADILSQCSLE